MGDTVAVILLLFFFVEDCPCLAYKYAQSTVTSTPPAPSATTNNHPPPPPRIPFKGGKAPAPERSKKGLGA